MADPPPHAATTSTILHHASLTFIASLPPLLAIALLLFFFRVTLLLGTLHLTNLIDRPSSSTTTAFVDDLNPVSNSTSPLGFPRPPILFPSTSPNPTPNDQIHRNYGMAILYLISYIFALFAFISTYTCALGTVFTAFSRSHLGNPRPLVDTVHEGGGLGAQLIVSVLLRWFIRYLVLQLLIIWFSSRENREMVKLFVWVNLVPFSMTAPFPLLLSPSFRPNIIENGLFFLAWSVFDVLSTMVVVVSPFVVIMDWNVRLPRDLIGIKEGVYLVYLMLPEAIAIKFMETVVCGGTMRTMLVNIGGSMFALAVQAVAEVYFMVAWLVLYFAARIEKLELHGRRIGLEGLDL